MKIILILIGIICLGVISIFIYFSLQRVSMNTRLGPEFPVEDFVMADVVLLSTTEEVHGTDPYPKTTISVSLKNILKYQRDNRATYLSLKTGDVVKVQEIDTSRIWPVEDETKDSVPVGSGVHLTKVPERVDLSAKPEITTELLQSLVGKTITVSMWCSESVCYSGRIHKLN